MNNYFKVYKKDGSSLTTDEKITYVAISATTDFNTGLSSLTFQKISELSGIKSLPSISKHIKVLEGNRFITYKSFFYHSRRRYCYQITPKGHYEKISREIFKAGLSKGELALYISLVLLKYQHSNIVDLMNTYEHCGVSKPTYYKYLNSLKEKGLLDYDNGVVTLLKYIDTDTKCSDQTQDYITTVLTEFPKSSAKYQQIRRLVDSNGAGVKSVDSLVKSIEIGVPLHKKNIEKPTYRKF